MLNVISASRRTDIPAFYPDWFMKRIEAGYCKYRVPMGPVIREVSLRLEDVLAIVFWSRNYGPMIEKGYLQSLKTLGYDLYFHFTVVDYPELLDPNVIDREKAKRQMEFLSTTFGIETVIWRYDPIVFCQLTGLEERLKTFSELLELFGGYTKRCVISFLDLYKKTILNMEKEGIECNDPLKGVGPITYDQVRDFLRQIVKLANGYEVKVVTCCEKIIRKDPHLGIEKGHCIDRDILGSIIRDPRKKEVVSRLPKDRGQRVKFDCGCYKSVDIGRYDTCIHGCIYCYANVNKEVAKKNYNMHDPEGELL